MKLDGGDDYTLKILKPTEWSTLKGLIVWYVNYISREVIFLESTFLLKKKDKTKSLNSTYELYSSVDFFSLKAALLR